MAYTIPGIRGYRRVIVMQIGYLMLMRFTPQSGYVFLLGGGAISWKSCKQTILTRSTIEAELTTLDTATVEG